MNKKAFVSYAMYDKEQYVLTLLADLLREEGFSVDSSYDGITGGRLLQYSLNKKILDSDLFIGVITQSNRNNHVLSEWRTAYEGKVPSLLLIEDLVKVNPSVSQRDNVLRFNRFHPETAIQSATERIRQSKLSGPNSDKQNVVSWLLGGLAILALIKLLSSEE